MRKILALILAIALTLAVAGCSKTGVDGGFEPDPIKSVGGVYVDSTDDFEDMGIILSTPTGATDISYGTIDGEIALIHFTLDGFDFNLRSSKVKEGAELHQIAGEYEDEAMGQQADGVNWCSSINAYTIKGQARIATSTISIIDETEIYLTLDTTTKYNMEDLMALMSVISSDCVENTNARL